MDKLQIRQDCSKASLLKFSKDNLKFGCLLREKLNNNQFVIFCSFLSLQKENPNSFIKILDIQERIRLQNKNKHFTVFLHNIDTMNLLLRQLRIRLVIIKNSEAKKAEKAIKMRQIKTMLL